MNSAPAPESRGKDRAKNVALCAVMCVWVFAFAPEPIALATLPAAVAGLALVERCRRFREAALWLAVFGAVAIGIGYSWLAETVQRFGQLSVPTSWLVLVLFGALGTVHAIVFAFFYRLLLRPDRRPHPMVTVLLFVACEVLPIRFLPWMAGNGAVDVAPLRQAAEWGGVAAVSFALLCLFVPFHEWLRWVFAKSGAPARPKAALVTFLVGAAVYGFGWIRHDAVLAEEREATRKVRVGIVQGNLGSLKKRAEENSPLHRARASVDAYRQGTDEAIAKGAELVVWPETVFGGGRDVSVRVRNPAADRLRQGTAIDQDLARLGYGFVEASGRQAALLIGAWADEQQAERAMGFDRDRKRYNAAILREAGGKDWSLYRKVKLIPFGERMPLSDVFPSLRDMLPQQVEAWPGPVPQPPLLWKARGLRITAFICYEAILPDLVNEMTGGERPDLLANLTNDSWYGDTWEPRQHLNFSRFRAVEHRAPMLRATNTGISAFVDPTGEVLETLPYDRAGTLVRDVPLVARGRTVFARFGDWIPWLLWGLSLVAIVLARSRRPIPPGT
jgi:apolipoprotein N-acyltransferase